MNSTDRWCLTGPTGQSILKLILVIRRSTVKALPLMFASIKNPAPSALPTLNFSCDKALMSGSSCPVVFQSPFEFRRFAKTPVVSNVTIRGLPRSNFTPTTLKAVGFESVIATV
jgi:hypothetical protein